MSKTAEQERERYLIKELNVRMIELTKPTTTNGLRFADWTERLGALALDAGLEITQIRWVGTPEQIVFSIGQHVTGSPKLQEALLRSIEAAETKAAESK